MRPGVSSSQEIQTRLRIFRRTLSCLLDKAISAGGEDRAPFEVTYQLAATRRELDLLERKLADLQRSGQSI